MDKYTTFKSKTSSAIYIHTLFGTHGVFEKTAGAPPFADWETGDAIRDFLRTITPQMRRENCYTLMNALGAGEFYSSNINADHFGWNGLSHHGYDYGYKTFLNAHCFQHHQNKDIEKAIGRPVLSLLNNSMKRVELITAINRTKAKFEGADDVLSRLDRGEFPDISMGAKVPFDECSICFHKSKTMDDHCIHMRPPPELRDEFGPNKFLPDGRKIFVYNPYPRFFDISFVFIGADKTAKVMAKLSSKGSQICLGKACITPSGKEKISNKTCVPKIASSKLADIIKRIPVSPFYLKRLPEIERLEPELPPGVLDNMSELPLGSILSGTTGAGVILKPHEFQRIVLNRMGERPLADRLYNNNSIFKRTNNFGNVAFDENMSESLKSVLPILNNYIKDRTAFGEPFKLRVIIVRSSPKLAIPTQMAIQHPLLSKISSAYNSYRLEALMHLPQAIKTASMNIQLNNILIGDALLKSFSKTSSISAIASDESIAYILGVCPTDKDLLLNDLIAKTVVASNIGLLEHQTAQRL